MRRPGPSSPGAWPPAGRLTGRAERADLDPKTRDSCRNAPVSGPGQGARPGRRARRQRVRVGRHHGAGRDRRGVRGRGRGPGRRAGGLAAPRRPPRRPRGQQQRRGGPLRVRPPHRGSPSPCSPRGPGHLRAVRRRLPGRKLSPAGPRRYRFVTPRGAPRPPRCTSRKNARPARPERAAGRAGPGPGRVLVGVGPVELGRVRAGCSSVSGRSSWAGSGPGARRCRAGRAGPGPGRVLVGVGPVELGRVRAGCSSVSGRSSWAGSGPGIVTAIARIRIPPGGHGTPGKCRRPGVPSVVAEAPADPSLRRPRRRVALKEKTSRTQRP